MPKMSFQATEIYPRAAELRRLRNENIVFGEQCINVALCNSCVFEELAVMNYFTQP